MKEYVMSLKEKKQHNISFLLSNCLQVLDISEDWPCLTSLRYDYSPKG